VVSSAPKGEGQSDFSDRPLFMLATTVVILSLPKGSHTLGACSTIGPAELNLRRLEGVMRSSFAREPAAKILSVLCEGSPSRQLQKEKATNISVDSLYLCRQRR
jgi:hypothetical protein